MPQAYPTQWSLHTHHLNHTNRDQENKKTPNTRKRKTHLNNLQYDNQPQLDTNTQTQPTIKHGSVAQTPPHINMAFPASNAIPYRNPPTNTSKYKQTTLDQ